MRRLRAGVSEATAHDPRVLLRRFAGRRPRPTAAVTDGRTSRSTPEGGGRAGWDGAGRRKGSEPRPAVDTPGDPPAAHVTPADEQGRAQVERSLARAARLRRLARGRERLPPTPAGPHLLAFMCVMVQKAVPLLASGP